MTARIKRGKKLFQELKHCMTQDKQLFIIPAITTSCHYLISILLLHRFKPVAEQAIFSNSPVASHHKWLMLLYLALTLMLTNITSAFFHAWSLQALQLKFQAGPNYVKKSLNAIKKKLGRIAVYALYSATSFLYEVMADRLFDAEHPRKKFGGSTPLHAHLLLLPYVIFTDQPLSKGMIVAGDQFKNIWGTPFLRHGVSIAAISLWHQLLSITPIIFTFLFFPHSATAFWAAFSITLVFFYLMNIFNGCIRNLMHYLLHHYADHQSVPEGFSIAIFEQYFIKLITANQTT